LFNHQVTIGTNQHVGRTEFQCTTKAGDTCLVLGDVVRRLADAFGDLGEGATGLVGDERADRGGTGVASARAVARDDQASIRIRRQ
jgi:hypothetical protein